MNDEEYEALVARYFAARAEFNAAYAKFEPARAAYFTELARRRGVATAPPAMPKRKQP